MFPSNDESEYNNVLMQIPRLVRPLTERESWIDPVKLFSRCASDREDSESWSEFLRRYGAKIKYFIRGTLRQDLGSGTDPDTSVMGIQESDLFQSAILRLVDRDCAVMKKFSGTTEDELLAYLAVITRSVVRDELRRRKASKRQGDLDERERSAEGLADHLGFDHVLLSEIHSLSRRAIASSSPETFSRDRLVFELHFQKGLSPQQIADCKGINLTKGGVEKVLNRVLDRVRVLASDEKREAMQP